MIACGVAAARECPVTFTADTAGHLHACHACPGAAGLGGIEKRASFAIQLRAEHGQILLLDAGNALFGAESLASRGLVIAEAYAAIGYDALNLSYRDFRFGLEHTRALLRETKLTGLSANLLDDQGSPVFQPMLVKEAGGERVAIIGLTEKPAGMEYLPHLKDQLAGMTIADPVETLQALLPEARQQADRVIVLLYGSPAAVSAMRAAGAGQIDALLVGGTRPAELGGGENPRTAASSKHGQHLTLVSLGEAAPPRLLEVTPDLPEDEAILAIVKKHAPPPAISAEEHSGPAHEPETLPEDLGGLRDEPLALNRASGEMAAGKGLRLEIERGRLADAWQGEAAGPERAWLILDARIENDIPLAMAFSGDREAGEAVRVALRQNLYLVGGPDGRVVLPAGEIRARDEAVMPTSFTLERLDSVASGEIAFSIPTDLSGPLQVRLYHDEFEPAVVDLRGRLPVNASLEPAAENEYAALARPAVRFPELVRGEAAPAGSRWVEVDLYGQSRFTLSPKAAAGSSAPAQRPRGPLGGLGGALNQQEEPAEEAPTAEGDRPRPAVYLEAPSHLQVIADGQWAHTPMLALGSLPEEPVFLPDRFTGGTAVFLVPADAKSLELACYFPQLQGMDPPLKPAVLRFAIEGDPKPVAGEEAMAVVNDAPLPLAVVGARAASSHGEFQAQEGRALLLLDCRIRNEGEADGLFAATGRFNIDGGKVLSLTGRSGTEIEEPMLLPAGERRAFVLVADVPATFAGEQQVGYNGVALAGALPLTVDAAGPAVARADEEDPEAAMAPRSAPGGRAGAEDAEGKAGSRVAWARPGSLDRIGNLEGESALSTGAPLALKVTGQNDGVRLHLTSIQLLDEFAGAEAPQGQQYLVLHTRWENLQRAPEPTERVPKPLPPTYESNLEERLFLVLNGRRIVPRYNARDSLPRNLSVPPVAELREWESAAQQNPAAAGNAPSTVEGTLAYRVPTGEVRQVQLHLLDAAFGNIELDVLDPPEPLDWEPLSEESNRIAQVGVFGFDVVPLFQRSRPGTGMTWLVIDFRGRSLRKADPADPQVKADTPLDHVALRWNEGYCHLLIDGRYPIHPDNSEIAGALRFLPGAMVGGQVGFRVPQELLIGAQRIELVFDYHETPVAGEALLRPEPATIVLKDGPVPARPESALTIDDIGIRLDVTAIRREAEAGRAAPEGREWLVLDVDVTSTMATGEWFEPWGRLRLSGASFEAPVDIDQRATNSLGRPGPPRNRSWWIPAGETRSMQLAWEVDAGVPVPPLRYTGLAYEGAWSLEDGQMLPPPMPEVAGQAVIDASRRAKGIESVGLRPEQVNTAIERGRLWLWEQLQQDLGHSKLGDNKYHLAMLLALVHTEAHKEFPEFDSVLREYLSTAHPTTVGSNSTYKNGLLAMVVEGYGDPAFRPLLEEVARYLIEDQGYGGSWNYNSSTPLHHYARPPGPEAAEDDPDPEMLPPGPLQISGGDPPPAVAPQGAPDLAASFRRHQAWEANGDGDNSVSQFAVLGLWSCQRGGVEIDPEVWRRVLRATWSRQSTNGGWPYHSGNNAYGSMSCAGLGMAAIAVNQLRPELELESDPRIREGLAWLAEHWEVGKNFEHGTGNEWAYYCTYGIERVGRILGTEFIGQHEWYPPLAKWLVSQQAAEGAWPAGGDQNARLSTTFALLFLVRATPTLEPDADHAAREEPTTGTLRVEAQAVAPGSLVIILDASGSMLAELDGRQKFEMARDAVSRLIEALPERANVGLVVYGHRLRAIEPGADEDVEVLIPPGPLDKAAFSAALAQLRPRGRTPLALSLDKAAGMVGRDGETTVVLLTDGGQGREPGDPVAAARALGARARVQVVGFDIGRVAQAQEWGQQLRAMAEASGGRYLPADDAQGLEVSLQSALSLAPASFTLLRPDGSVVAEGEFGQTLTLDPGEYLFRTTLNGEPLEQTLWIAPGRTTLVRFDASRADEP